MEQPLCSRLSFQCFKRIVSGNSPPTHCCYYSILQTSALRQSRLPEVITWLDMDELEFILSSSE